MLTIARDSTPPGVLDPGKVAVVPVSMSASWNFNLDEELDAARAR
jgi:hypothetical protein